MDYKYKSHPTRYKSTLFRSRLEARYAAFFDLLGFTWEYEPFDLEGWTPDFLIHIPCTAITDCTDEIHDILIEIKPYTNPKQFEGHALTKHSGLGLGYSPRIYTNGQLLDDMMHHAFMHSDKLVSSYIKSENNNGIEGLWAEAGNMTRYQAPKENR